MGRNVLKSDGCQYRQQSFISLVVYLNDDFCGGKTNFWLAHDGIHCRFLRDIEDKPPTLVVTPVTGSAILMDQNLLHEGSPVEKQGVKYILRTDIIFERQTAAPVVSDVLLKRASKKNPEAEQEGGVIAVGDWERIFESSCKNYAD
uniref:Prolyl 4-hydroxylase alpha subunit Fe(2+) 2OG dioxygenase domain-containing protein n=1 Tax=Pseudictyota dubia TaxID=2749911 RepID=A0A7R9W649_9STRA